MDGFTIRFSNYPEILADFINESPKTNASILLDFRANGIFQNKLDPFVFEIGAARTHWI